MKKARNIAASHRAKLLVLAQHRGDNFQFLLGRWTIERFLYRLSQSRYRKDFVLQGAMLFLAWGGKLYRPTRDLDLLGFGSADLDDVTARVREICAVPADDGRVAAHHLRRLILRGLKDLRTVAASPFDHKRRCRILRG